MDDVTEIKWVVLVGAFLFIGVYLLVELAIRIIEAVWDHVPIVGGWISSHIGGEIEGWFDRHGAVIFGPSFNLYQYQHERRAVAHSLIDANNRAHEAAAKAISEANARIDNLERGKVSKADGVTKSYLANALDVLKRDLDAEIRKVETEDTNTRAALDSFVKYVEGAFLRSVKTDIATAEKDAVKSAENYTTAALAQWETEYHDRVRYWEGVHGIDITEGALSIPLALAGVASTVTLLDNLADQCLNPMCTDYSALEKAFTALYGVAEKGAILALLYEMVTDPQGSASKAAAAGNELVGGAETIWSSLGLPLPS